MTLKVNDNIVVDGKKASISAIFASGAHTRYELSDGRSLLDLEKSVVAEEVAPIVEEEPVKKDNNWKSPYKK